MFFAMSRYGRPLQSLQFLNIRTFGNKFFVYVVGLDVINSIYLINHFFNVSPLVIRRLMCSSLKSIYNH